ncbi:MULTISPECIES: hypothetical protein [unclassified Pseudoalteromonas]|uniref:hypothetical protein n=1 Tax=unclassified Pseudoalteromonas TaxID=194690 RepID=UPI00235957FC|nr:MULTISPECIES: hypothetical protein [unclassified Pseudoalteromonas]MDC9563425.1 hypothetical protein [Pseudoalteromonas sp. GAB2316C]MDC9572093.1 hypothetical protein [Pseudoalteromonas sp. GABNS16A]MDC9583872.1 hypothetical protein [Pseudoalteromonas sp. GABNS16C]MDC9607859.1 hypothetical protein [Pseudoalteromonas sp. GABNS16H]
MGITPSLNLLLRQIVRPYGNYPKFEPVSGGKWRFTMGITPSLNLYLAENGASLWELPQVCTCIWRKMALYYGNYPKFAPVSSGKRRFTMGITPSLTLDLSFQ